MSDIFIKEIRFHNYRQYGDFTLRFDDKDDSNMTIIIAQNGTGKTTFLNAIAWCLYDKEYHIGDEAKALPRINIDVLKKCADDERKEVSVTLIITEEDKIIEFSRKQTFIARVYADGRKDATAFRSVLTVTTTENYGNTKVCEGDVAELIVKKYFDESIRDYYFFDGEELKSFFTERKSGYIKETIKTISQVTLMENVTKHMNSLISEYRGKLAHKAPDVDELHQKMRAAEKEIEQKRKSIEADEENIKALESEKKRIDKILSEYRPVQKQQEDRLRYEKELEDINEKQRLLKAERSNFVRRYTILLNLYPRMKSILKYIDEKEKSGDLPPAIDLSLIRQLLDILKNNHEQTCKCPMCNSDVDESSINHLEDLLAKQSVSSETSNFLKEIKGSLQKATFEALKYHEIKAGIFERESELQSKKDMVDSELKHINHLLVNYKDDKKIDVSALELKRGSIDNSLRNYEWGINSARAVIETKENEKKNLQRDIDKAIKKNDEQNVILKKKDVATMLYNNCSKVLNTITGRMRSEIETTTREIFDEMNWKTKTFGKMVIDEWYFISLYNQEGLEMTASLSATEQMALAYSFILAVHKASGQNAPLVIDSPIGRSSDMNRENIAHSLMKISENKQIVMLFTPDDFTPAIQQMFEGNATIERLSLSEDEKFVVRGGM